jgi:hypothetical protein
MRAAALSAAMSLPPGVSKLRFRQLRSSAADTLRCLPDARQPSPRPVAMVRPAPPGHQRTPVSQIRLSEAPLPPATSRRRGVSGRSAGARFLHPGSRREPWHEESTGRCCVPSSGIRGRP